MKPVLTAFIVSLIISVAGQPMTKSATLRLRFVPVVGAAPLHFDTVYHTKKGEDFKVSRFKYYLSSISLIDAGGKPHSYPNQFFLADSRDTASLNIVLPARAAVYKSIRFTIGVDSLHNVSGAQSGALDPVKDMFWTWNTGYIMAKLEGSSSLSTLPNGRIEYHIGGFRNPYSVLRTVDLPFVSATLVGGKTLMLGITADLLTWFEGRQSISIAARPACMTPGPASVAFADNYATMFSIQSVQVQ